MAMEREDLGDHLRDDGDFLADTCDTALVFTDGSEVLVHSHALIMHSRFFRRMIADIRCGDLRAPSGDILRIPLDDTTQSADVELLLRYLYNRDAMVTTVIQCGDEILANLTS